MAIIIQLVVNCLLAILLSDKAFKFYKVFAWVLYPVAAFTYPFIVSMLLVVDPAALAFDLRLFTFAVIVTLLVQCLFHFFLFNILRKLRGMMF